MQKSFIWLIIYFHDTYQKPIIFIADLYTYKESLLTSNLSCTGLTYFLPPDLKLTHKLLLTREIDCFLCTSTFVQTFTPVGNEIKTIPVQRDGQQGFSSGRNWNRQLYKMQLRTATLKESKWLRQFKEALLLHLPCCSSFLYKRPNVGKYFIKNVCLLCNISSNLILFFKLTVIQKVSISWSTKLVIAMWNSRNGIV